MLGVGGVSVQSGVLGERQPALSPPNEMVRIKSNTIVKYKEQL